MKRNLLIAAACLTTAVVLVPAALADPVNAKNASQITAMCNGQPVTVVVNGNGTFSPAHVIANTSVFIPTAFDLTFTFTPSDGSGAIVDTNTAAKTAPIRNTITCMIPPQTLFSGPDGTATLKGTVTGFFTPR